MVRRAMYIGTWFAALFFIWTATFAAEQITLTTYYPAPVGDYQVVTTGKLNIDLSGTDDAAGVGTIPSGSASSAPISTNRVTAGSLIFLTVEQDGVAAGDSTAVHVESIAPGSSFVVRRSNSADLSSAISFFWLIIN